MLRNQKKKKKRILRNQRHPKTEKQNNFGKGRKMMTEGLKDVNVCELKCSHCGNALCIVFGTDCKKTLGCIHCSEDPVITHEDYNRIMEKFIELGYWPMRDISYFRKG